MSPKSDVARMSRTDRARKAAELVRDGAPISHAAKSVRLAVSTCWFYASKEMAAAFAERAANRNKPDADLRREAMRLLVAEGWSYSKIGGAFGVSKQYVQQVVL